MNNFIILFRESLEAALIVGIVYTFLHGLGAHKAKKFVWYGLGAALAASVLIGFALHEIEDQIQNEAYNNLFEGTMMFVAAGFLLYMVVWMSKNSNIAQQLKEETRSALASSPTAIFGVVFFAVLREGFETAMFLFASDKMGDGSSVIGAILGIAVACILGYLIFARGKKIPLKKFFNATSILLILMASGMVAYGFHEMEEFLEHKHLFHLVGLEDTIDSSGKVIKEAGDKIARPWDILKPKPTLPEGAWEAMYSEQGGKYVHLFHDKGKIGSLLKAFFGYNSNPNWVEFLMWIITLISGFYLWNRAKKPVEKKSN